MEKRYQVFVSSTFEDLVEERQQVLAALLKSDCFPAGMELFPASDQEQFEYIRRVIDDSDYYVVISAGMYGSLHPTKKIGYTELEYDYAVAAGKPIVRLLHKDPFKMLSGDKIESTDAGRKKLSAFRQKLTKSRMVSFWEGPADLGQQVLLGLLEIKKRRPAIGWVRSQAAESGGRNADLKSSRQADPAPSAVLSFDSLKEKTAVPILAQGSDATSHPETVASVNIANSQIAEAVLISLMSSSNVSSIAESASDMLTEKYAFPQELLDRPHVWLELEHQSVKYALHYLESLGAAKVLELLGAHQWSLTFSGRRAAARISSEKNFT